MKLVFWLLLAANLVFFVVAKMGVTTRPDPQVLPEYRPELIRILTPPAPVSSPAAAVPLATAIPVPVCHDWGEFSGSELIRAEKTIAASLPAERWSKHFVERANGYWVFIPPQASPAMLLKRSAELKMNGINDFYSVKEEGPLLGAISLGAFKQREGAEKLLARLQAKGVSDAKLEPYLTRNTYAAFTVSALTDAEGAKLKEHFSASHVQTVTCPAPTGSPKP